MTTEQKRAKSILKAIVRNVENMTLDCDGAVYDAVCMALELIDSDAEQAYHVLDDIEQKVFFMEHDADAEVYGGICDAIDLLEPIDDDADAYVGSATVVRDISDHRRLYKVEPPVEYERLSGNRYRKAVTSYVVSDYAPCPFDTFVPETMVFPADRTGNVLDWGELSCIAPADSNLDAAVEKLGYKVVTDEPTIAEQLEESLIW